MNYSFARIVLAARNNDAEGWMNILFIVVVAAFWLIGGILKARANKVKGSDFDEEPSKDTGLQGRRQIQPLRRKTVRPWPAGEQLATEKEHIIRLQPIEAPQELELPPLVPLEEFDELISKPIKEPEYKRLGLSVKATQPKAATIEPLLDFEDTDKLRRAILHYEILGKPLSLRKQAEHIIGL